MDNKNFTKCLIIGGGPAGYTAAIYASRANLDPIIYEGMQPGGQLTTTTEVENFPGYPDGIEGPEMMDQIRSQASKFGAELRSGVITSIDLSHRPFKAKDDAGEEIVAETVVIATGATAKYLGLPDEQKYLGMGVSACATCDGFFYRKKVVAVVGGGDTACEEALYLSTLARKVYLIVRKDYLRASKVMQHRVMERENITVLFNTNTVSLHGDEVLQKAVLVENKGTDKEQNFEIDIDGFFLAIGHKPNTEIFKGQLELDNEGYVIVKDNTSLTSVEGVFAAGDVADTRYKQAITSAGSGCKAAMDAERFLVEHE